MGVPHDRLAFVNVLKEESHSPYCLVHIQLLHLNVWMVKRQSISVLITCAVESTLSEARNSTIQQVETISKLGEVASKYPYYKYNGMWTRDMQNAVSHYFLEQCWLTN